MFRILNPAGSTPREISEVVNNAMNGKTNNTGTFVLESSGANQTTVYDERVGFNSVILFSPTSSTAAGDFLPYGAWEDSTNQTIASTTTAYVVTFNTTNFEKQMSLVSGSRITADYAGLYNIQFSCQIANADTSIHDISLWFRKNGTNIPNSNTEFSVPNKHGSVNGHICPALNFYVALDENEYVELVWSASSTQITMEAIGTQTNPTRPASPSVILTVQYVSSDGYTEEIFTAPYILSKAKGSFIVAHPYNDLADKTYDYVVVG
jgi:hypothetical protein